MLREPHRDPPPGWRQRVRRGLSFPPGELGQAWEVYRDRLLPGEPWRTYQINVTTLEVYHQMPRGWDAPGWLELTPRVRARLWTLHLARGTATW